MSARSGKLDEKDPPKRLVDGNSQPVLAVRMKDTGFVYFDLDAVAHFDVVMRLGLDSDQVADGGWIIDGKWDPGHSGKYSSKDPVEIKRINDHCDEICKSNKNDLRDDL
jgi:hypothetical protein